MIPPGERPKAWWYHVEGARRRGAPAMVPPRRGKGIFVPWTALLACRIGTAIRSRSRLATKQISPCHGLATYEFGPSRRTPALLDAAQGRRRARRALLSRLRPARRAR